MASLGKRKRLDSRIKSHPSAARIYNTDTKDELIADDLAFFFFFLSLSFAIWKRRGSKDHIRRYKEYTEEEERTHRHAIKVS